MIFFRQWLVSQVEGDNFWMMDVEGGGQGERCQLLVRVAHFDRFQTKGGVRK